TLPPRIQMTSTGNEAQATVDGTMYTWYEVETAGGARGWIANDSDWLARGDCDQVLALPPIMRIIESPTVGEGNLWNPKDNHYAIDVYSVTGDLSLYSPLDGTVAASDSCHACLEVDPVSGKNYGDFADEYNNGYGAMVITEYPYEEMSQEQIDELSAAGISVEPGQSMYLMTAHLNPNRSIAVPGTNLTAGASVATVGTSGNSTGVHAHIEAAVAESGLRPDANENINAYWIGTVVDTDDFKKQGNRVNPTPIALP
ncbi:MAG: M23 family metallopeptidase, partial [Anaerolineales bacterium]